MPFIILTQQQQGKAEGGFRLTSSTLASIAKYPVSPLPKTEALHTAKVRVFPNRKAFEAIVANTSIYDTEF